MQTMEKTLQQILAEYEYKRNFAQQRQEAQLAALFAAHPKLKELQEQKKSLIVQRLMDIMKRPQEKQQIVARSRQSMEQMEAEAQAYLEKHGLHLPQVKVDCPLCQDTGYLQAGERKEFCTCLRARLYVEALGGQEIAALKGSFEEFDEAIFPDTQENRKMSQKSSMLAIRSFLQGYAQAFPKNPQKQILLIGSAGLGKSYCLACLCKELQKKQPDICYFGSYALFRLFHRHRLGEIPSLGLIYEAKVLAIDDLGNEPLTQNVSKEYLFDLLNVRMQRGLHTFIATNNTVKQLQERYTEPVASRLLSDRDTLTIRFSGEDLRLLS